MVTQKFLAPSTLSNSVSMTARGCSRSLGFWWKMLLVIKSHTGKSYGVRSRERDVPLVPDSLLLHITTHLHTMEFMTILVKCEKTKGKHMRSHFKGLKQVSTLITVRKKGGITIFFSVKRLLIHTVGASHFYPFFRKLFTYINHITMDWKRSFHSGSKNAYEI